VKTIGTYQNKTTCIEVPTPILRVLTLLKQLERTQQMSVTPSATIVGIFRDRSMAEQAIEALYNAGFGREQTSFLAPGTSGGFVENLKSIFTGTTPNNGNFSDNLTNMGLSDDEASFYSNEYNKGNVILAVRAPGREQEALNIMHQYGAYNSRMQQGEFNENTNDAQQSTDLSQQSPSAVWGEQHHAQSWQTQPQYRNDEQYSSVEAQQLDTSTEDDYDDIADETTQPVSSKYSSEPQNPQENEVAPEQGIDYWATQPNADTSEHAIDYQAAPAPVDTSEQATNYQATQPTTGTTDQETAYQTTQPNVINPEYNTDSQTTQAYVVSPQHEGEYQTITPANSTPDTIEHDAGQQTTQTIPVTPVQIDATQVPQSGTASTEHIDEKQQLQQQLQTLQQQLQEAKTQLQAAKEQEDQLRSAREREQELQAARQQLQDVQSELQATLAELQASQSRLSQYK
jgi:hypothetical protein